MPVAIGGGVDGEDNGISASSLAAVEKLLRLSVVLLVDVELLEDDLALGLGLVDLLQSLVGVKGSLELMSFLLPPTK